MKRKLYRVEVHPSFWGSRDGRQDPIVRIYSRGQQRSIPVSYSELSSLILKLNELLLEHELRQDK